MRPRTDPSGAINPYYGHMSFRDACRHGSGRSDVRFAPDPPSPAQGRTIPGGAAMKANLTRITVAVSLVATMALSLAAGLKW